VNGKKEVKMNPIRQRIDNLFGLVRQFKDGLHDLRELVGDSGSVPEEWRTVAHEAWDSAWNKWSDIELQIQYLLQALSDLAHVKEFLEERSEKGEQNE